MNNFTEKFGYIVFFIIVSLFVVSLFNPAQAQEITSEKSDMIIAKYNPATVSFKHAVCNTLVKYYPEKVGNDVVSLDMFKFIYLGNDTNAEYWQVKHNYLPYIIELEKPYGYEEFIMHISEYNGK